MVENCKSHSFKCECGQEVDEITKKYWLFLKAERGHIPKQK